MMNCLLDYLDDINEGVAAVVDTAFATSTVLREPKDARKQ